MDYSTALTIFTDQTPLSKNIIDEVLVYVYEDADAVMWYLVESGRIFNETALRHYNLAMLNGVLKWYRSCHKNIVSNIRKNNTLVWMLEEHAIPTYADLCMLKGQKNYTRLQGEQIEMGECEKLRVVFPLKTLTGTIRAIKKEKSKLTSSQLKDLMCGMRKPTTQQEMIEFVRTMQRLDMARGGIR